jgi:hypothetical protein
VAGIVLFRPSGIWPWLCRWFGLERREGGDPQ